MSMLEDKIEAEMDNIQRSIVLLPSSEELSTLNPQGLRVFCTHFTMELKTY